MNRSIAFIFAVILLALAALATRSLCLDMRPMHGDEGRDGCTFGRLLETGKYTYYPKEYHGPALYYLALPGAWIQGKHTLASLTEYDVRIVPVICSVGIILLLLLLKDALGYWPLIAAAILTVLSPAFVYYSRYYVHEMLLVFFTFAAIVCAWRYGRSGKIGWAIAIGAAVGMMHATKETFIIALGCMTVAALLSSPRSFGQRTKVWHWIVAGLVAAAISITFFSSFFTYRQGPIDSILTYKYYLHRGRGEGEAASWHIQPWYYYLKLLSFYRTGRGPIWSEAFILILAAIGAIFAFLRRNRSEEQSAFPRFLAIYSLLMLLAYCIIPYKTPWLLLNFLQPLILLAGYGAVRLVQSVPVPARSDMILLLLAGAIHLGYQAYNSISERYCADVQNPYVYAHTGMDFLNMIDRVNDISKANSNSRNMLIYVICDYVSPIPWYLRQFNPANIGYWYDIPDFDKLREWKKRDPDMLIVDSVSARVVNSELPNYKIEYFGFRSGKMLVTFTREDLWNKFIESIDPRPRQQGN